MQVWYADLADVVQRRKEKDMLDELVVKTPGRRDLPGDEACIVRHAIQVRAGLDVAQMRQVACQLQPPDKHLHRAQLLGDHRR